MNKLLIFSFAFILSACGTKEATTITFTDELKPQGLMPEAFEVSNNGKIIFLSNRFNPSKSVYQEYWFCELKDSQLDSLKHLMQKALLIEPELVENADSLAPVYKIKVDELKGEQRTTRAYMGNVVSEDMLAFIEFVRKVPDYTERFDLKKAYFFSTEEICFKKQTSK